MVTGHHHKYTGSGKAVSYSGTTSDDCNEIELLMQSLIIVEAIKIKSDVNIASRSKTKVSFGIGPCIRMPLR